MTLLWLIRFIVPISCVICNDIMAYMFGFFFGRTPLIKVGRPASLHHFVSTVEAYQPNGIFRSETIAFYGRSRGSQVVRDVLKLVFSLFSLQLSPKKTWEGFIGGFFSTIVFGILVRPL